MWPFRRRNTEQKPQNPGPPCPRCRNTNTRLVLYHGGDHPNYVKVWRGQRTLTYRCVDCGLDFYGAEPQETITDELIADSPLIDDEQALREAEEEMERQIEDDDDRRCQ